MFGSLAVYLMASSRSFLPESRAVVAQWSGRFKVIWKAPFHWPTFCLFFSTLMSYRSSALELSPMGRLLTIAAVVDQSQRRTAPYYIPGDIGKWTGREVVEVVLVFYEGM